MARLSRSVLGVGALLLTVVVAGCSSSSAPKLTDPNQIITESLASANGVKTVHLKVDISGKISADMMKSAMGSSASAFGGSLDLKGTTIEMDADATDQSKPAVHITAAVPALLGLSADLILVDGSMYTKVSLSGDKYTKTSLGSVLPGGIASAAPSASLSVKELTDQVKKALDDAGIKPVLKGTDKVDGKDAYHVSLPISADKLNSLLSGAGSAASSLPSGLSITSASLDYWVYVDGNRPAKLEVKGASSLGGNLDVVVTLTNYGKSVSIKAPPADQIQE